MSAKQYASKLKQAGVPASEITIIVNEIANQGKNERFTLALEMEVIETHCIFKTRIKSDFCTSCQIDFLNRSSIPVSFQLR